jgi:hypothetical protein
MQNEECRMGSRAITIKPGVIVDGVDPPSLKLRGQARVRMASAAAKALWRDKSARPARWTEWT